MARLALNEYCRPTKFFTDLKELLEGLKQATIDHKHMCKANVLHRDVSVGNIILQSSPSNDKHSARDMVSETRGILIDLDHAKSTTKKTTVPSSASSIDPLDQKDISRRKHVDEDVALQALTVYPDFGEALGYTSAAQRANVLKSDVGGKFTWSSVDLGWKDVGKIPDFQSHQPDKHERTVTIPFISHQLLDHYEVYPHAAIHDMESFWWILVYICLTRQSGGVHQHKDSTPELEKLVYKLFKTEIVDVVHNEKFGFLQMNRTTPFDNLLKTHIHDYFEPVKSLLTRWRDVLLLGYEYSGYEYYLVHDYVLAIIDDTLMALGMVTHPSFQKDKQELDPVVIAKEFRPRPEEYASLGSIGRQTMYKVNLARDVSLGTVILQPLPPNSQVSIEKMVSQTVGILIDSDHSKSTSKTKTLPPSPSIKPEGLKYICNECNVSESVVLEALTFCSRLSTAGCYIDAAQTLNVLKLNLKCIWSSEDLGWRDTGEMPDFRSQQPDNHDRRDMIPFISHQLLHPKRAVQHAAIHDMESFWWVLVHVCLTRKLGGARQQEDSKPEFKQLVHDLFHPEDSRGVYGLKLIFFQMEDNVAFEELLTYIHQYFHPPKSLLARWRDALILGYTFKAYEYYLVHDYFLGIIDDTLKDLALDPHLSVKEKDKRVRLNKQELVAIEKVLGRRREGYAPLCNVPINTPVPFNILQGNSQTSALITQAGLSPPEPQSLQRAPSMSSPSPPTRTVKRPRRQ